MTEATGSNPLNNQERSSEEDVDALGERLRSLEGVDKDIAELLAQNWQRFIGAVAIVLVCVWLFGKYKDITVERRGSASDRFTSVQEDFSDIFSADNKLEAGERQKLIDRFQSNISQLASSSQAGAYSDFAKLYRSAASLADSRYDEALEQLADFNLSSFAQSEPISSSSYDSDNFVRELAALLYARINIAKGDEQATQYLSNLAKNSRVIGVEALVTLGRLAKTDEERNEVKSLAKQLVQLRPELSEAIRVEMGNLGLTLD